jgi:preprotein translocase subunit SecE
VAKLSIGKINLRDNRVVNYFRETFYELKKVSWPTRSEALNLTTMVIVVTLFLSVVLSIMDWLFEQGFSLIIKYLG